MRVGKTLPANRSRFMILSGIEIAKNIGDAIRLTPYDSKNIGPNSYNLHLHEELLVYNDSMLDMKRANGTHSLRIPPEGMVLEPGRLYLGRTVEYTETDGFISSIESL